MSYPTLETLESLIKNDNAEIIEKLYKNPDFVFLLQKESKEKNTLVEIQKFKEQFKNIEKTIQKDLQNIKKEIELRINIESGELSEAGDFIQLQPTITITKCEPDEIYMNKLYQEYDQKKSEWESIRGKAHDLINFDHTICLDLLHNDYNFSIYKMKPFNMRFDV
jgi:hypothetical protein